MPRTCHRRPSVARRLQSWGLDYTDVEFATADGAMLSGWYLPSSNGAAIALLHGWDRLAGLDPPAGAALVLVHDDLVPDAQPAPVAAEA